MSFTLLRTWLLFRSQSKGRGDDTASVLLTYFSSVMMSLRPVYCQANLKARSFASDLYVKLEKLITGLSHLNNQAAAFNTEKCYLAIQHKAVCTVWLVLISQCMYRYY